MLSLYTSEQKIYTGYMLAINLIIVCNFVICRQMYAIFKRLVFLHSGRVNKDGVVSTSRLNENLE